MSYELSAVLCGHKSDVRGIAVTHDDHIVSCSRDKTAKLWKPNRNNSGYTEVQTFVGHKNFVTCVCVVSPNSTFLSGLIITGGNDNAILVFIPESSAPVQQFVEHENTVCKIVNGVVTNTILSASWDKSVKVWSLSDTGSCCTLTIKNHEAAVWTVLQTSQNLIVSGSADKTIKVFQPDGSLIRTLKGHSDCVRDIVEVNSEEILSCSNDATIRRWSLKTGGCVDIMYGHPNFIYNLCIRDDVMVSGGEDRCLMVWSQGKYQSVKLPAQSVWSVSILSNKDVVAATSDGVIRIFTADEGRKADEEIKNAFVNEVMALNEKSEQYVGGVKVSDLPGPETLEEAGTKEGQTKLVREDDGGVMCYSWSVEEKKWNKLGNVVSGSGGTPETSGKILYDGKEYDFVFNVDIEDGKQPLKLPYNKSEDPWFVAQAFIHKHRLPQGYLEQVANFIINNSKQGPVSVSASPSEYMDPFTGGNRYVPGSSSNQSSNGGDPFTGSNRYIPMDVSKSNATANSQTNEFFPQTTYIRFDQANLAQILDKLNSFNKSIENETLKFSDEELLDVASLGDSTYSNFSETSVETLKKLLNWPKNCIFPVLDILRLAVRNKDLNDVICSDKLIFGYIKDNLLADSPMANQMLCLRTLCNMLSHPEGEKLVLSHKNFIIEIFGQISNLSNKSLQIALVTLMLNMATAFRKTNDLESQSVMLLNLINIFPSLNEQESLFRALVTLGTILSQSNELSNCIDSSLKQLIMNQSTNGSDKVKECSKCVLSFLT